MIPLDWWINYIDPMNDLHKLPDKQMLHTLLFRYLMSLPEHKLGSGLLLYYAHIGMN